MKRKPHLVEISTVTKEWSTPHRTPILPKARRRAGLRLTKNRRGKSCPNVESLRTTARGEVGGAAPRWICNAKMCQVFSCLFSLVVGVTVGGISNVGKVLPSTLFILCGGRPSQLLIFLLQMELKLHSHKLENWYQYNMTINGSLSQFNPDI